MIDQAISAHVIHFVEADMYPNIFFAENKVPNGDAYKDKIMGGNNLYASLLKQLPNLRDFP